MYLLGGRGKINTLNGHPAVQLSSAQPSALHTQHGAAFTGRSKTNASEPEYKDNHAVLSLDKAAHKLFSHPWLFSHAPLACAFKRIVP